MGKFTKDQLLVHMPSCKDLIQTADAQTGHAQTVHAQTSNAQTGHTQPTLVSQEPVRSVDPNTSQTPAIPSTSYQGILKNRFYCFLDFTFTFHFIQSSYDNTVTYNP